MKLVEQNLLNQIANSQLSKQTVRYYFHELDYLEKETFKYVFKTSEIFPVDMGSTSSAHKISKSRAAKDG